MPIRNTHADGSTSTDHLGCVVEVRKFTADRNHSDTLDYTDFRATDVTEALVYVGRVAGKMARKAAAAQWQGWPNAYYVEGEVLAPIDRFQPVEITNLFVWRGSPHRDASVDAIRHPDCVIDYADFIEARALKAQADADKAADQQRAQADKRAAEERNRPVVGKQMVVARGRKVKPGTLGTVAYVRADGRVLLKADAEWKNRKADGVWVDARHLNTR